MAKKDRILLIDFSKVELFIDDKEENIKLAENMELND